MVSIRLIDDRTTIQQQLDDSAAPVILVNIFHVVPEEVDAFLAAWENDARWMKQQPGYISTQMHRGIGGSCAFLNYAVWESVAHFRQAFTHPQFRGALSSYPSNTIASPHLFVKIAIPNICTS
jgi:heme-degrading monooxygenase HmoA